MTKEKLLEWGLTEEQATKVMEGLNGSFVTKARFNEVNTELTAAKNTIKERDTQLETLKKASGDTKALQDQITQLQADNKKKDDDHAAELKNLKISNAVELALTGAKAKNNTAVKALLADFMSFVIMRSFRGSWGANSRKLKRHGIPRMIFLIISSFPPLETWAFPGGKRFWGLPPKARTVLKIAGSVF